MVRPLLLATEPPAFEIVNAGGRGSAVLVCDHASNRVPEQLDSLGLTPHQLSDHISWDPGAAKVARHLSAHLDAPLAMSAYSRLVIDCNRGPGSTESIAEQSAGVPVPGNHGLSAAQKNLRVNTLFNPYHLAIKQLLDDRERRQNRFQASTFLSIHSFSPVLNGELRPWHIGISCRQDRRFAKHLIKALSESGDLLAGGLDMGNLVVGDNQPYPISDEIDYTIPSHAETRALPYVMIEIRQDMIRTDANAAAWGIRLADAYRLVEEKTLHCSEA